VATDLRVRVEGGDIELRDVVPALPADLFAGQDLVVMARYTGAGSGRVVVEGRSRGRAVRWTADAKFATDARDNAFIPRLWAAQRIGYLSAQKRKNGGSPELDDEIRTLGERYGIPTEFTSYLVQEPRYAVNAVGGVRRGMPMGVQLNGVVTTGVAGGVAAANVPEAKFEAARLAASERQMKTMAALDSLTAARWADAPPQRTVHGHTFLLRDGRWVDGRLTDSTRVVQVQAYSKSYFTLLDRIPELRAMAALGDRVVMVGRAVAIEIVPRAGELSDSTMDDLVRSW